MKIVNSLETAADAYIDSAHDDPNREVTFARNASYLEAPKGISAQELWDLMGQAK